MKARLATNDALTTKIGEVQRKIKDVSGLVTTNVINTKPREAVIEMPYIGSLVKKKVYNTKISGIVQNAFLFLIIISLEAK